MAGPWKEEGRRGFGDSNRMHSQSNHSDETDADVDAMGTDLLRKDVRRLQCENEKSLCLVSEFVQFIGENAVECFQMPAFLRYDSHECY